MLGILQIDWHRADLPRIARFGTIGVLVILVSALLNAVAPEAWNSVVGRQEVSYRLGIPSLTGIFDHPVGLASVMGMAFLAILSYRRIVERSMVSLVLMIAAGAVGILTFRRKSIVSVLVVAIGTRLALPGKLTRFVILLVMLLPLALLLGWAPLTEVVTNTYNEYFTNIDSTARTTMTIDSAILAAAAFPLGVGLGRFGSAVASSNYSPVYEELGYTRIYGMGPGERGVSWRTRSGRRSSPRPASLASCFISQVSSWPFTRAGNSCGSRVSRTCNGLGPLPWLGWGKC